MSGGDRGYTNEVRGEQPRTYELWYLSYKPSVIYDDQSSVTVPGEVLRDRETITHQELVRFAAGAAAPAEKLAMTLAALETAAAKPGLHAYLEGVDVVIMLPVVDAQAT